MTARSIRLLHVEDDAIQRRLLQAHLQKLADLAFAVTAAESEDEAVGHLPAGFDLVLLDYHLSQGNGLTCLKRLRNLDPHIPIIAISGVATPEIAAELLEAGADDYFSKDGFEPEVFSRSVRAALARADAWKARAPDVDSAAMSEVVGVFDTLSAEFVQYAKGNFLEQMDKLEAAAKKVNLTFAQLLRLFENTCNRIGSTGPSADVSRQLLRPMMLEIVLRLYEEAPGGGR